MLKPHFGFQGIEHGLDNKALAQHDLVGQGHQIVPHVAPDAGNEVCVFRAKSAADSGMKSATDSDLISALPI